MRKVRRLRKPTTMCKKCYRIAHFLWNTKRLDWLMYSYMQLQERKLTAVLAVIALSYFLWSL